MSALAPCLLRLRAGRDHVINAVRGISTSYTTQKWKFTEKVENDVTVVGMEEVPEPVPPSSTHCALCTCSIPVKLSYSSLLDMMWLLQFEGSRSIPVLAEHYPALYSLYITNWNEDFLELDVFSQLNALEKLSVKESEISTVSLSDTLASISYLNLDENRFVEWDQFCNVTRNMPSLEELSLNGNQIRHLTQCIEDMSVNTLKLRGNKISSINTTMNEGFRHVDLSSNSLSSANGIHGQMISLNLSHNPLTVAEFPSFQSLEYLDLSGTKFTIAPQLNVPVLRELVMDLTTVEMIDFSKWIIPNLKRLSMRGSYKLKFASGQLPEALEEFSITNSKLAAFPQAFFSRPSLLLLNVSGSHFDCDPCVMQWSIPVAALIKNQTECSPVSPLMNCTLGISQHDPEIVRAEIGQAALLPCTAYGTPQPTIEWWLYRPKTFLGVFDPRSSEKFNETSDCCSVLGGGALLLHSVNRSMIERYVCVARQGSNFVERVVHFRLDYSSWYSLDLFNSVFWGGIATAVLACSFSFLLNITWILTRKSILWWIQRAERLSRVRKMVEAMEKYRARQMESLQAKYARRMQMVRENYHAQVEQLRLSYSSQAERFRDYRAAQMEHMSSHLENIRDNYNQQMQRVREYGSRRAEQLWESYERQVNRVKAFSLQHRLKMMRQYKVKQRYLNRLLESFQDTSVNAEALRQQEQEVRAALEMPVPPVSPEPHPLPLSRTSSFYSLPEYVIDDEGILRPSPIIGRHTSNSARNGNSENRNSVGTSVLSANDITEQPPNHESNITKSPGGEGCTIDNASGGGEKNTSNGKSSGI
ncbi:Immunoglobulin domain and leucine-rich repeat-containing protein 2 [Trichostrongylus colubriformis]|uniref:Immunoglobulin domain and leucine-rich repeat-containing protein 2 n=1 Tax=Trichostrongylus colubriformis TaxID=6319 RepID=A0AAN8FVW8_TRICO